MFDQEQLNQTRTALKDSKEETNELQSLFIAQECVSDSQFGSGSRGYLSKN
jgi:hypothetical protein